LLFLSSVGSFHANARAFVRLTGKKKSENCGRKPESESGFLSFFQGRTNHQSSDDTAPATMTAHDSRQKKSRSPKLQVCVFLKPSQLMSNKKHVFSF
jgi:hypothetical protein